MKGKEEREEISFSVTKFDASSWGGDSVVVLVGDPIAAQNLGRAIAPEIRPGTNQQPCIKPHTEASI